MKNPEVVIALSAALSLNACQSTEPQLPTGFSWATCSNMGGLRVPKPEGFNIQTFSGLNREVCIVSKQPIESADDPIETGLTIESYKALTDPNLSIAQPAKPLYPGTFLENRQTFTKEKLIINRQSFMVYANQRGEKSFDNSRLTLIDAANNIRRTVYRATFETPVAEYQKDPQTEKVMTDVNNLKFNPDY